MAASGVTKIGCSTAAFTCMADGSSRGQAASTSMPAMTAARTLESAFQEMASVRLPTASVRASASGRHRADPNRPRLASWPTQRPTWPRPGTPRAIHRPDGFFASSQLCAAAESGPGLGRPRGVGREIDVAPMRVALVAQETVIIVEEDARDLPERLGARRSRRRIERDERHRLADRFDRIGRARQDWAGRRR